MFSPNFFPNDLTVSINICERSGPACCDRMRAGSVSVSVSEPVMWMKMWSCMCKWASLSVLLSDTNVYSNSGEYAAQTGIKDCTVDEVRRFL